MRLRALQSRFWWKATLPPAPADVRICPEMSGWNEKLAFTGWNSIMSDHLARAFQ